MVEHILSYRIDSGQDMTDYSWTYQMKRALMQHGEETLVSFLVEFLDPHLYEGEYDEWELEMRHLFRMPTA